MRNIFRPLSPDQKNGLEAAMRAIAAAVPLSAAHSRELPHAVRDLSRALTRERSRLDQPYWISPRLMAAYCRYFLPWNLVRLSLLLPNLRLALSPGDTVLDLGSGPLTMPVALWLAYPEWRTMPLTFVCNDSSPKPMQIGRDILQALAAAPLAAGAPPAEEHAGASPRGPHPSQGPHPSRGEFPWRLEFVRGPLEAALRGFRSKAALITAGNVLNELPPDRETPLEERLAELAMLAASRLAPGGRFLIVEPGSRLGGKLVALTRRAGFAAGLVPESPCPHWGPCPMLARRATGWCHFSHAIGGGTEGAPQALADLTRRAKLEKDGLTLSCLLLRPARNEELRLVHPDPDCETDELFGDDVPDEARIDGGNPAGPENALPKHSFVRIISDLIRLPDRPAARYACSDRGLALVLNALRMPSGAAMQVRWPEEETRDPKSGAVVVPLVPAGAAPSAKAAPAPPSGAPAAPRNRKAGVRGKTPARPAAGRPPAAASRGARPGRRGKGDAR